MAGVGGSQSIKTPTKRLKLQDINTARTTHNQPQQTTPISPVNRTLDSALPTLDKQQLLTLLSSLLRQHPQLESDIQSLIPQPTLSSVTSLLSSLEKKLIDNLPYTSTGPDSCSDYAYNRSCGTLNEINKSIIQHLSNFVRIESYKLNEHEYPELSISYLHFVTSLVHRLPNWSNPPHHVVRHELYHKLARAWLIVVGELGKLVAGGRLFGEGVLRDWSGKIQGHAEEVKGHFGFGGLIGEFERAVWVYKQEPQIQQHYGQWGVEQPFSFVVRN
jgi:hypothetical protein